MKKFIGNKKFLISICIIFLLPVASHAHQPRIVERENVYVTDPEISKVYYGKLKGEPVYFKISAEKRFVLYLNILVPDIPDQDKDLSFAIIKNGDVKRTVAVLDGSNFEWKKFWEEFGRDNYWQGPEYRAYADAGEYEVMVWSSDNDSKYAFAIGGNEAITFAEAVNALLIIPEIKRDFFNESPIGFALSPWGYGYIVVLYTLAFLTGFITLFIRNKSKKAESGDVYGKPIKRDRLKIFTSRDNFFLYFFAGLVSITFALSTSWNPIIIFFSGLAFFAAIFGRYGISSTIEADI